MDVEIRKQYPRTYSNAIDKKRSIFNDFSKKYFLEYFNQWTRRWSCKYMGFG